MATVERENAGRHTVSRMSIIVSSEVLWLKSESYGQSQHDPRKLPLTGIASQTE